MQRGMRSKQARPRFEMRPLRHSIAPWLVASRTSPQSASSNARIVRSLCDACWDGFGLPPHNHPEQPQGWDTQAVVEQALSLMGVMLDEQWVVRLTSGEQPRLPSPPGHVNTGLSDTLVSRERHTHMHTPYALLHHLCKNSHSRHSIIERDDGDKFLDQAPVLL